MESVMGTDYKLFIQVAPKAVSRRKKSAERERDTAWRWITCEECETLGCAGYDHPLEEWGPRAATWYADRSEIRGDIEKFRQLWEGQLDPEAQESCNDLTYEYHEVFDGEPVVCFKDKDLKHFLAFMPNELGEAVKKIERLHGKELVRVVLTLC
jgi:hypothetical protein